MLAKDPSNESLLLASAELASLSEEGSAAARKFVERAIVAHPASVQPRMMLITLAARERDSKAAVAAAQAAAAALPGNAQIQEALGTAQLAAGDANQAIETFQRLTKQEPQNVNALVRLAEAQASSKDVAGAIVSARKAVALKPDQADYVTLLSKLLLVNNQADDAIAEARRVQKARPRDTLGYVLEGEIRAAQNRWPDATAAYRQALSRQASPLVAARVYAALMREGKPSEAAAFATQWNRDNPKDITVRVLAAQAAQGRRDTPSAIAEYRAALAIEPDSWVVMNNLAWLLSTTDQPAARELAERAYHLAPLNPGVLDTLGWILVEGQDPARGVPMLRMAANLAPRVPEIRLHYGMALAKIGDKTSARRQLEMLTRLPAQSTFRADAEKALATL
jgi:putative PEP-CTERM system TPR-repeat lipoprotein